MAETGRDHPVRHRLRSVGGGVVGRVRGRHGATGSGRTGVPRAPGGAVTTGTSGTSTSSASATSRRPERPSTTTRRRLEDAAVRNFWNVGSSSQSSLSLSRRRCRRRSRSNQGRVGVDGVVGRGVLGCSRVVRVDRVDRIGGVGVNGVQMAGGAGAVDRHGSGSGGEGSGPRGAGAGRSAGQGIRRREGCGCATRGRRSRWPPSLCGLAVGNCGRCASGAPATVRCTAIVWCTATSRCTDDAGRLLPRRQPIYPRSAGDDGQRGRAGPLDRQAAAAGSPHDRADRVDLGPGRQSTRARSPLVALLKCETTVRLPSGCSVTTSTVTAPATGAQGGVGAGPQIQRELAGGQRRHQHRLPPGGEAGPSGQLRVRRQPVGRERVGGAGGAEQRRADDQPGVGPGALHLRQVGTTPRWSYSTPV